jgi:hypothetical protein
MEWLIMGHLTEDEAKTIINESEMALKYNRLNQEDLEHLRLSKIPERSVFEYNHNNEDP